MQNYNFHESIARIQTLTFLMENRVVLTAAVAAAAIINRLTNRFVDAEIIQQENEEQTKFISTAHIRQT